MRNETRVGRVYVEEAEYLRYLADNESETRRIGDPLPWEHACTRFEVLSTRPVGKRDRGIIQLTVRPLTTYGEAMRCLHERGEHVTTGPVR